MIENNSLDKRLRLSEVMPSVVQRMIASCRPEKCFQHWTPHRYSNTTILNGDTVIGARSTIGGNAWIAESISPDTKVYLEKPELIYSANGRRLSGKKHKNKMAFRFKGKRNAAGSYN